MTATADILTFASARLDLSDAARDAAQHFLADTLAVGAGGAASSEAAKLAEALRFEGGPARLLGRKDRADPQTAAFWNGFAIHCLEWDPVHEPGVVHALSVVTATLLAVIDETGGVSENEALTALAVGVDVASGLGVAATGAMRFFRPATAGIIGAALAAARITDLPPERFADVLGLSYSQAAGTMQAHVEASVALPLQIGLAARAAVTAVHLAKAGLGGPHDALEGPFGYSALFEELDLSRYRPGDRWLIEEVSVKPYPSGRASHGVLGELEQLAAELNGKDIERITASVPPLIHRLVARPWKPDMEEGYARLCLPFLTSLMLRDGVIDPRAFTDEAFADPVLTTMAKRTRVVLDDSADPNALAPQLLTIELASGEVITRTICDNLGSRAAPMSQVQTATKLTLACACAGQDADPVIFDNPISYFCGATR